MFVFLCWAKRKSFLLGVQYDLILVFIAAGPAFVVGWYGSRLCLCMCVCVVISILRIPIIFFLPALRVA